MVGAFAAQKTTQHSAIIDTICTWYSWIRGETIVVFLTVPQLDHPVPFEEWQ
jgi:hypothetical protein